MPASAPVELHLTDKQARFALECARGTPPDIAATLAGYTDGSHSAWLLRNNPNVQAAIAAEVRKFLHTVAAPAAINLMYSFMIDDKKDDKLRLACAKTVADRAGFIAPKARDDKGLGEKSLVDMTAGEMKEMASRIQRELSERAVQVLDGDAREVAQTPQPVDMFE